MNRSIWLLCALGGSLAWGQGNPPLGAVSGAERGQERQKLAAPEEADAVAMDAPVMTIKGFCPAKGTSGTEKAGTCETVITREQFEKMAAAIRPNMTASVKQQLASLYPRLLVMAQAAEEMGLDKQSPYEQMIVFSRLQILTQGVTRKLQQESGRISDEDVAEYYRKNPEMFEEYTLERLFVPLRKTEPAPKAGEKTGNLDASTKGSQEQAASSERQLDELAKKLQLRAAAGEDFLKLQREAFDVAGLTVASPTTSMGAVRRTALPAAHKEIFGLKAGEVSPVITDAGGHYIYKVEAKDGLALDKVKDEIRQTLESQRAKEALEKIQNSYSTELNQQYFAAPAGK
jgi:bifunctional DNA-binding transcriptional regulator/antitoxin component of YhaV-PrlF toxin-antitoxin module